MPLTDINKAVTEAEVIWAEQTNIMQWRASVHTISVLVHLVAPLFISSLEEGTSGPGGDKINYLERLHRFLSERSVTFWHELRCFAERTLNMETYDTIVEYAKW
nr:hypothetical protein [Tanacetum cinerariifolium]